MLFRDALIGKPRKQETIQEPKRMSAAQLPMSFSTARGLRVLTATLFVMVLVVPSA